MHTSSTEPIQTFRTAAPYPFCPGCGHGMILDHLNRAMVKLQLDPRKTVIVSDIGCVGLSDQYFNVNAFHGLHGRSVAYASGIKLARPDLKVIVVMGDGGCGIGGTHLINAARRNVGVTVLVFNNLNFGMTGGQHSVTTPQGSITTTTREGNLERPLDICATAAVNGASYVYRGTSFDKDLSDRIVEAISREGFGLLDIWELCTAYFVPNNDFSRKALTSTLEQLKFHTGVLHQEDRPEYAAAYRLAHADERHKPFGQAQPITPLFSSTLDRTFNLVAAGSAGGKVRSAARLVGLAGILSGLWAAQRDDYPVTVKSGYSISQVTLSPSEVRYTGASCPDALVIITPDGYKKTAHYLRLMTPENWLFVTPDWDITTSARKIVIDLNRARGRVSKANSGLVMLAAALKRLALFSPEALEEAARQDSKYAEENLAAIAAGNEL